MRTENNRIAVILFIISVMLSIIGYLGVDKLNSINESIRELKTEINELSDSYLCHDRRLQKLETN